MKKRVNYAKQKYIELSNTIQNFGVEIFIRITNHIDGFFFHSTIPQNYGFLLFGDFYFFCHCLPDLCPLLKNSCIYAFVQSLPKILITKICCCFFYPMNNVVKLIFQSAHTRIEKYGIDGEKKKRKKGHIRFLCFNNQKNENEMVEHYMQNMDDRVHVIAYFHP